MSWRKDIRTINLMLLLTEFLRNSVIIDPLLFQIETGRPLVHFKKISARNSCSGP
jgi:hypothetical protein